MGNETSTTGPGMQGPSSLDAMKLPLRNEKPATNEVNVSSSVAVGKSALSPLQAEAPGTGRDLLSSSLAETKTASLGELTATSSRATLSRERSQSPDSSKITIRQTEWDRQLAALDSKASEMAHCQWTIIREQLTALYQEQTVLKSRFTDRFEVLERRQQEGQAIAKSLQQARLEIEPALEKRFSDALQREIAGLREGGVRLQQAMSEEIGALRNIVQQERGSREEIHLSICTRLDEHHAGLAQQDELHAQHRQDREEHAEVMRDHVQRQVVALTQAISRDVVSDGEKHEAHEERAEHLENARAQFEDRLSQLEQDFMAERAKRDKELKDLRKIVADEKRAREAETKMNEGLFLKETQEREAKIEQVKRNRAAWVKEQFVPMQDRVQLIEKGLREVANEHKAELVVKHDTLRGEVRKLEERHQTVVKEFKSERVQREALNDDVRSTKDTREGFMQRIEALEQRLSKESAEDRFRAERKARAALEEALKQQIREATAAAAQLHQSLQADLLNERLSREADDGKLQERCRELQAILFAEQQRSEEKHSEHQDLVHNAVNRTEKGVAVRLEVIESSVLTLDERIEREATDREAAMDGLWAAVSSQTNSVVRLPQVMSQVVVAGASPPVSGSVVTQPPLSPVSPGGSLRVPPVVIQPPVSPVSPGGSLRVPPLVVQSPAPPMEPIAMNPGIGGVLTCASMPAIPTSSSRGPTAMSPRGPTSSLKISGSSRTTTRAESPRSPATLSMQRGGPSSVQRSGARRSSPPRSPQR